METNTISSAYRKKVGVVQTTVEHRLEPETETAIGKILCVNAKPFVESVEVLNGEAHYIGEVLFNVIFTDETGELLTLTDRATINGKIEENTLNAFMQPLFKVEVVDVSIQGATTSEVRVSAVLEVTLDVITSEQIEPFLPESQSVIVKHEPSKVWQTETGGTGKFSVQEEYDLKQNINRVVLQCASLCVKDVTAGTGYFTVEGDVVLKYCLTLGEEKQPKMFTETIAFKEEIEVEGIKKDDRIETCAFIRYNELTLQVAENGEARNNLSVTVPIVVKYVVLRECEVVIPIDSYSLTHRTNLSTDTYQVGSMSTERYKEHVEGSMSISEDQPRINKIILASADNLNVTNSYVVENAINIEGVITATVIYLSDDDAETTNSVQVEIPFSLNLNYQGVKEGDGVFAKVEVTDLVSKAKKGKDIELDAELYILANTYNKTQEPYVKDVVLTEEIAQSPYSLQIYLAPAGSTLWDISKHLNVSFDVITEQNKLLEFPLQRAENIVYFKQR